MNLQDDELVRRYHEASAQEGARPGAHVREAVRAHAQMVAAAHTAGPAPTPEAPPPTRHAGRSRPWPPWPWWA